METRRLGSVVFEGPPELLERIPSFHTPRLPLRRVRLSEGGRYRNALAPPSQPHRGSYEVADGVLLATLSDDPLAGQSAALVALAYLLWPAGLLLHAACVVAGDRAIVALGPSGAGKSTLSRLAAPMPLLSDEAVAVARVSGTLQAFGAPVRSSCNRPLDSGCYPLGVLVTLRKGPGNVLRQLTPARAVAAVLSQSRLLDRSSSGKASLFALAGEIASQVRCFELEFTLDGDPRHLLTQIDFA